MRERKKVFRIKDADGKRYRFTNDELVMAWNITDRVDKADVASLYLHNYCMFDEKDFTCDEWWTCVDLLIDLYSKKFNSGANDKIWKSACDEFMDLWEKGDVI
jgi:hypothetical protein